VETVIQLFLFDDDDDDNDDETFRNTFIYIALFTIHIVSKQLHSNNMKIIQQSLFLEENYVNVHLKERKSIILLNIKCPQLSKPKAKATVARNQNSIR